ncbi:unnamed protein product [Euphydryas editha]|uniref:Uncharacterized protein n=1 Tax=Euphydryas editha TaxID=104508 RepID=A0AAU9UF35_EUPED|nr:unnamed protein product [Euphydryas editha]
MSYEENTINYTVLNCEGQWYVMEVGCMSELERSEALSGRLSKSASELSCSSPIHKAPPRARSAHHHAPLSVVYRTQHFFNNLKTRWQRSKSRERCPAGTMFSLAPQDSSGNEYAADQSSEHSTPANSPRRKKDQIAANISQSFGNVKNTSTVSTGHQFIHLVVYISKQSVSTTDPYMYKYIMNL